MSKRTDSTPPGEPERLLADFPPVSAEEWRQEAERLLRGASFDETLLFPTYEGITLRPWYTRQDAASLAGTDTMPGTPPYLRGARPLGYRQRPWEIAQELPYPTAAEFNAALRHDLERGQTAVVLLADLATRSGRDPDSAPEREVGWRGTSLASLADLERALDGIDLQNTPLHLESGPAALPLTAMLVALVRRLGGDAAQLQGCVGADPLGALAAQGQLPCSVDQVYDELALLTRWAQTHAPRLRTVSALGLPYAAGGASAVQELACTLAAAVAHLRALEQRGLEPAAVAPRLQFGFAAGTFFFLEIAKLRAARRLWSQIVAACGGDAAAQRMMIHVRTSRWSDTVYDPHVNILRGTTRACAAVIGGCDSLHVAPLDEARGLADEFSRRLARNTQIILRQESHLDRVIDPAGGSWFVEELTDEVAHKVWSLFQEIEAAGGLLEMLSAGRPQADIAAVFRKRLENISRRREVLVGTNRYADATEAAPTYRVPDQSAVQRERSAEIQQLRPAAGGPELDRLTGCSGQLGTAAADLFETVIEAAEHGHTLGELTSALRGVAGPEPAGTTVKPIPQNVRGEQNFLAIRNLVAGRSAAAAESVGGESTADVFLACIGPVSEYMARLDFARGFFQSGGFRVAAPQAQVDDAAAAQVAGIAARAAGAPIVCIVSTDERYPVFVPALASRLKQGVSPPVVVLAGRPRAADETEIFRQAGIDHFLTLHCEADKILWQLADALGGEA